MSISRAAHGKFKSNLARTSGCRTPIIPTDFPFTIISPHRPGKKVGSRIKTDKKKSFVTIKIKGGTRFSHNFFSELKHGRVNHFPANFPSHYVIILTVMWFKMVSLVGVSGFIHCWLYFYQLHSSV